MSVLVLSPERGEGRPAASAAGLPALLDRAFESLAMSRPARESAAGKAPAADQADSPDVQAARGGDGDAYARLVRRYQNDIAAYMWRFTRDRAQWEELVHDVFVEAYFSLRGYRGDAPLLHWLRRIATRVGYRWWKRRVRQRRESPLESCDWQGVAAEDARQATAEAAALVHALLARMSPRDRLVLTLLYLEECSVAEAARLSGWSQAMVKVQAFRARKRMKKLLEQAEAAR